jgi:hypothetical protein
LYSDEDTYDPSGLDTGLSIDAEPVPGRGRKYRVKVRYDGALLHSDTLNPHDAAARAKLVRAIVTKACQQFGHGALAPEDVEPDLLAAAERCEAEVIADRQAVEPGEYMARIDGDPEVHGLYRLGPNGPQRVASFTATIDRDVQVHDDVEDLRQFEGTIRLDGAAHPFAIAADDFGDAGKFRAAIYTAAGPRARFIGKADTVRDGVSALSTPVSVARSTAAGWDRDATAYLTPTGVVDRHGFRPYRDGEPRVDLGTDPPPRALGLSRLDPGPLAEAKRHLVEDYLKLHERRVMFSLLGAVALAVLERHAGWSQRLALWLLGQTGAGKSFPAKLAMNFFGDYPLHDNSLFVSWSSTANYIERTGYWFRDANYLVDDYKPEFVAATQSVRIMQAYADGAGRGRLNSNAKAQVTRPIRGLLLSTGEDLPQNNASTLARMVIVDVPNRPKELERGARCLAMRPLYRGVMADFIRHLIVAGRLEGFAGRVAAHRERFYADIIGRPNDARIAGNFALLAAAFQEFALYLGDVWPDWEELARVYVEEDLVALRDRTLGIARQQQASEVFLDTLRPLLAHNKVRFQGDKEVWSLTPVAVIGKAAGEVYEVSIPMALAAVQEQLRRQGRDPLKVSDSALIQELEAAGKVVPPPTKGGAKGEKSHSIRVDGRKVRCVRIPRAELSDDGPAEG